MTGKALSKCYKILSKCYNLSLPQLTDWIDGRKKQMIPLPVSSGFTLCNRLSKLKAFFAHLMCLDDTTESEQGCNTEQTPNRPSGMRHDQADGKILPLVERRSNFDKTASHDQKVKTNSSRPSSVWIDASQIGRAPNKQLFGTLIKLGSKALYLKVIYGSTQYLILFESSTLNQLSPISL